MEKRLRRILAFIMFILLAVIGVLLYLEKLESGLGNALFLLVGILLFVGIVIDLIELIKRYRK